MLKRKNVLYPSHEVIYVKVANLFLDQPTLMLLNK